MISEQWGIVMSSGKYHNYMICVNHVMTTDTSLSCTECYIMQLACYQDLYVVIPTSRVAHVKRIKWCGTLTCSTVSSWKKDKS